MSNISNTFTSLIAAHPTWDALKTYLISEAGGKLSVHQEVDATLAMIRYVKGQSDLTLPHTGAFRSVVWNTATNRPVSVTAYKSEQGECIPSFTSDSTIQMEEFVDGVMLGQFWDSTTESWRIHTRSTLDAKCRYFSKRSFAELFQEAVTATYGSDAPVTDRLDKSVSYTWILQHPENRVVCPIQKPRVVLVAAHRIGHRDDGAMESVAAPEGIVTPRQYFTKGADATVGRMDMSMMLEVIGMGRTEGEPQPGFVPVDLPGVVTMLASMRGSMRYQGVVIKNAADPFKRWKMRTQTYNQVRNLRGNTARRDFLWMDMWSKGGLEEYLKHYPEERQATTDLINRWKSITQLVFKTYVDAFKARTLDRSQIPAKIRPLVYGLHNLYMTGLKPNHKSLDWRETVRWMNDRDTAQKIFVLNWDLRQERGLPLEPLPTSALKEKKAETTEQASAEQAEKEEGEL